MSHHRSIRTVNNHSHRVFAANRWPIHRSIRNVNDHYHRVFASNRWAIHRPIRNVNDHSHRVFGRVVPPLDDKQEQS